MKLASSKALLALFIPTLPKTFGYCSGGTYTEYDIDNLGIETKSCSSLKDESSCEDQYSCHWVERDMAKGYCAGGSYKECKYGSCWTEYCSEEKYKKWCENLHGGRCYWVGGSEENLYDGGTFIAGGGIGMAGVAMWLLDWQLIFDMVLEYCKMIAKGGGFTS